jgi:hypothetical protein
MARRRLTFGAERVGRDLAAARGLGLLETARLAAMVNLVGADALMSALHAKYHYLFWRPGTAVDPTAVIADGFGPGPVPGYEDGNAATVEQAGWRPAADDAEPPGVPRRARRDHLGDGRGVPELPRHEPNRARRPRVRRRQPIGNLDALRHFEMPNQLRQEIIDARLWPGLHYHFSGVAGVVLGRNVARYELRHAFHPTRRLVVATERLGDAAHGRPRAGGRG